MSILKYFFVLLLVWGTHITILSQDDVDAKWMRVQTDSGEVSVEIPEDHSYFFDKDGFFTSTGSASTYAVRDVSVLTALRKGTVIRLEVYRTPREALDLLIETAIGRGTPVRSSKLNEIPVKEIVTSDDHHRSVRYFFRSKNFVYVLSSASRGDETDVMKRFINSVRFVPDSKTATSLGGTLLRSLKLSPFELRKGEQDTKSPKPSPVGPAAPSPNIKSLIIASRPRASYTNAARWKNVQGEVRLRVEFASNGSIPRIEILEDLPEGLTRQAFFAALRLLFLPVEKDGQLISARKIVEYSFKIY